MFRGKESSNRIELSRLVQDLLNFGVSGSLWLWGGGGWMGVGVVGGGWMGVGGGWGVSPTHVHMHTHTRTCGKHDNFMQMAAPIGGIPGNSLWCHRHMCMHACVCAGMCVHVCGGHPLTTPSPSIHPPNQDISIPFEDLKSVETSPPMGRCIVRWALGWWVGSGQNTKNLKNLNLIEIIQFCLKIYDL